MSEGSEDKNGMDLIGVKIGVCIKSLSGRVLYQNKYCNQICGDHVQEVCTSQDGCMKFRQNINNNEEWADGIEVFKSKKIGEQSEFYDVAFIKNDSKLVTLLQPLENKSEVLEKITKKYRLTKKENEVLGLIMDQKTNIDISKNLNISKATLKTHINHLHQKVPDEILGLFRRQERECESRV